MKILGFILLGFAVVSAVPFRAVKKQDENPMYQYIEGPDGRLFLLDQWTRDKIEIYEPDEQNNYHLFTRFNPGISQPIVLYDKELLNSSNYLSKRRTIFLIHGWLETVTSDFNTVLVPAILEKEDVNVIVVDWSHGGGTFNYSAAVINTPISGKSIAKFITWLNEATGSQLKDYHIIGYSLGAHLAGIVGRHLQGNVAYITALDPALTGWLRNDAKFKASDGKYTEVIHTNAGLQGYLTPLGQVDFYPNGGSEMPGCVSQECDKKRSFFYMAESIRSGGFNGMRCHSVVAAMAGQCFLWGNINMGGLVPKDGQTGVYYLKTHPFPPFSRGY